VKQVKKLQVAIDMVLVPVRIKQAFLDGEANRGGFGGLCPEHGVTFHPRETKEQSSSGSQSPAQLQAPQLAARRESRQVPEGNAFTTINEEQQEYD
jgi:hypothetical protein